MCDIYTLPEIFKNMSSIISDWATFFAAITALFALLEMHKQRKHSYKPDILPLDQEFNCKFESITYCDWKIGKEEDFLPTLVSDNKENFVLPEIPFVNLGNGAARNIQFTWCYEYEKFSRYLAKVNQDAGTGVGFIITSTFLTVNDGSMYLLASKLKIQKNYFLPAHIDKSGLRIALPSDYILLVSNYFYLKFQEGKKDLSFEIPALYLSIKYFDIANNKYETKFEFSPELSFFAYTEPMPNFGVCMKGKFISQ